jgi:hypothetical protein
MVEWRYHFTPRKEALVPIRLEVKWTTELV